MRRKFLSLRRLSILIITAAIGLAAQASHASLTPQQVQQINEVVSVHKRNVDQLMAISNVVASGTSLDANGEAVIKVLTTDINSAGVPASIDGVRVVKEQTTRIVASRGPTCESSGDNICASTERWPLPVPIGVSVGHPSITAGTIGARVTDGSNVFILSNNHVIAATNSANIGDNIIQPGGFDGGVNPDDAIATLTDFEPITFTGSNLMDAGIALSTPAELGFSTSTGEFGSLVGYGAPSSTLHPAYGDPDIIGDENMSLMLGAAVQKVGRTTGHTFGNVNTINATVSVCYNAPTCTQVGTFVDQIIITPGGFSAGGDSGSLVVTNDGLRQGVGLLFAGSTTITIINRIDLVLNRFGVRLDDGTGGGNIPPVADFNAVQVPGTLSVDFDASASSDPDGTIVSYDWNFGDGTTGTGVAPSHTYAAAGSYSVSLTVTDDQGATNQVTQTVVVQPTGGAVCPAAICDNTDTGFSTTGTWASSTSTAGYYGSDYLHDLNTAKGSKTASWHYEITADGDYQVAARWTSYTNRATAVQYMYSVDGGALQNCGTPADQRSNGGVFNVLCTASGLTAGSTITVSLQNDSAGYVIVDAMRVEAGGGNVPPAADFSATQVPGTLTVDFDASASSDPDGTIVSYDWNFGDSTTGTGVAPSHTYAAAGSYSVSLTVTDDQGATNQLVQTVVVQPTGGAICAAAICDNTDPGFSTTGTWASSTSTAGYYGSDYLHDLNAAKGSKTASWRYEIGADGDYDVAAQWTSYTNRAANVQYMYSVDGGALQNCGTPADQRANGGQFNVLCTVNGLTVGSSLTVTVRNDAAGYLIADAMRVEWVGTGGNAAPVAEYSATQVPDTLSVDFDASASSDPDGSIISYDWDFGDGSTGTGVLTSHTYAAFGSYNVSLTVTDDMGASTTLTKLIAVDPPGGAVCLTAICDNSDPGFATVGAWSSSSATSGYIGTDYLHDQNAGKGTKTASWRYGIVVGGNYEIAAQWTAYSNRAASVQYMYSIDGGTPQACGAPQDQRANGGKFNVLCTVTGVTAGSVLTVIIDNSASGYVIADAVRATLQ